MASTRRNIGWPGLLGWIGVTAVAAATGSLASQRASQVYEALVTPSWSPPSWLFGPVWTTLYLLMAIAAWLVWREGGWARQRSALTLYLVQLGLNALWSWLFFAWQRRGLASLEIVVLWCAIALTIAAFARVRATAAWLLAPYLAWVTFATALCLRIWQLNG